MVAKHCAEENSVIDYDHQALITHEKINELEEIEILKAAVSLNILNEVINGRNDPLYKTIISVDN